MSRPRIEDRTKTNLLIAFAVAHALGLCIVAWAALLYWDASRLGLLLEGRYHGLVACLTLALWFLAEEGRTDRG